MDQVTFENAVRQFAKEYYASPRSTKVPTPRGPVDLAKLDAPGAMFIWVLEDFADFLQTGERDGSNS